MIFCGIEQVESIYFCDNSDPPNIHCIDIMLDQDEPYFYVFIEISGSISWMRKMLFQSRTMYERVRWCILDAAAEAEDIDDMIEKVEIYFDEYFNDLIIYECEEDKVLLN